MAVSVNPAPQNQFYQAPLEVPGYVNPNVSVVPPQPVDLYGLMNLVPPQKSKLATRTKNPYELMMEGSDPFAGLIPDVAPLQTNLTTIEPLDDAAGLFHSQDGFGKYGYSTILGGGDNEARYAQNFRNDNPNKFYSGINPFKLAYRGLYWSGAFLEKTLESAVVKTGQGIGALYGMTIGNSIDLAFGKSYEGFQDWLASSTDNIFSSMFDGWDENLKQRYHYFQEKSDRERKGFISSLGDGDFWMNDVSDGLSFLASSMFEVGLLSKANLGTKAASRLAPLADGVSTTALKGETIASAGLRTGVQRAMNILGVEGTGHAFVKNAVDLTSQTLATTAIESAVEAQEVKDTVYKSFEGKVNPETGFYYTEEEKQRLAASAAADTFRQNMTILIGPKFIETLVFNKVGQFAKGLFNKSADAATTASGKASGRVRSKLGNLSSGTTYDKVSNLKNILKTGSAAATGFLMEGLFEENIQLAISRNAEATYSAEDEFYRPSTRPEDIARMSEENALLGDVGRRYLQQTRRFFQGITDDRFLDDEISKSVGIGGLFGLVGGAVTAVSSAKQQAKVDNYWNNRLNAATSNLFESQAFYQTTVEDKPDPENPGKTKPTTTAVIDPNTGAPVVDEKKLTSFLNKMNNIQGIMDIIANTEDPNDENNKTTQNKELNKLARNVLFTQLAMEYIRAGKKDLLMSLLSSSSQFSDRDIQALGYEPNILSAKEKNNLLIRMRNIVERLDKTDQWIENNVLDNLSEEREQFYGLKYSKTQKEKRAQEFEAKKAYLRGLAMQNVLLDTYLEDLDQSEEELTADTTSTLLDEASAAILATEGRVIDLNRNYNARIPALENQISVLEKEFAYRWENIQSRERNSPKSSNFNFASKSNNGKLIAFEQIKAQEALERINTLQSELDNLQNERQAFMKDNPNFEFREIDGQTYVLPKTNSLLPQINESIDQLEAEKLRRINAVKREEIAIQKDWINQEWRLTAALKESKEVQGRPDTLFSRRMTLSRNAYNNYFQREVLTRDNSLGQRKLKLYYKEEAKRVTAKIYKQNEEKLLKSVRIQGKVQTILAEVNGQKLVAELNALLEQNLNTEDFATELKRITDLYNGKLMVISPSDKTLVDGQIEATEDEEMFVSDLFEFQPSDERFNDKYYNVDRDGNFVVKPEYDTLQAQAEITRTLRDRTSDLKKIKKFLQSIPESLPGDWGNPNIVRKRIADVYFETADSIIDTYNQVSNNGLSDIAGDSLSTKQDLDLILGEIDELGQLKVIFEDRTKTDKILDTPEFQGFINEIDEKINLLNKIKDLVRERLASRLRENQDFLKDTVNNHINQLGINFEGETENPVIRQNVENIVGTDLFSKLMNSVISLRDLVANPDQDATDRKNIEDSYWTINGQVSAIIEVLKSKGKDNILSEINKQKKVQVSNLEGTALMQRMKSSPYYSDIINNINDSVLGVLQLVFYQSNFTLVGVAGNTNNSFLDDLPSSPVYKFREDYNLRKFIRNVAGDNSRTPDQTDISKAELSEFLEVAKKIQDLEDLGKSVESSINMMDQVELEKEVVQAKIDKKDNKYDNLIVPSIQQLFFIRAISSFLKRNTITDNNKIGFRNWIFIQAPGGAGKTQTLGTWFNTISGIPRDRVMATAFTEEAARGIKKALLLGEEGPKDAAETADYIQELIKNKNFDQDILIIDEFPAIAINTQKKLFSAISEYTKLKRQANKGEFKVITMGDTNQLTFSDNGSVLPRPAIIINPQIFATTKNKADNDNHPAKMTIIPSLTVNFRSNIFAITSFVDQFKGSSAHTVNADIKVTSTDPSLSTENVKGVVSIDKANFQTRLINYLKLNANSVRTKTLIVNESKLDSYRALLQGNGITIITDPNDELTKGVYLTTVKNVQGFSFDEVFIDLENTDKVLFSGTSSPDFIYNKAMYVAASRARNLIVITNFPNIQNIQDDSINDLENKALEELQTKDDEFVRNRDLEIEGSKSVIGSQYARTVKSPTPVAAEQEAVETPLDQEPESEEDVTDEQEIEDELDENIEQQLAEENNQEKPVEIPATSVTIEVVEESTDNQEGVAEEQAGSSVISATGEESNLDTTEASEQDKQGKTFTEMTTNMWNKVKDPAVSAFNKVKDNIVELLFPTAQTTKYKVTDGEFTVRPGDSYENRNLRDGDQVILIPFQKSKTSNSERKFGYALVTPAIDQSGDQIEDSYRTVAILSDFEIDQFNEKSQTRDLYNEILENEKRAQSAVSINYSDVSDENGFQVGANKIINELKTGKVVHTNPVKYFYEDDYQTLTKSKLDAIIADFVKNYYINYLNYTPNKQAEFDKILRFYQNPQNAQIIIPTKKDVEGTKPLLNVPPELRTYVRAGRPYLMFRPYHRRSSMQFVALSRKFLNIKDHNSTLSPIRDFVVLAKNVRATLQKKGVDNKLGYSKSLSNMLSRLAMEYLRNPNPPSGEFKINLISTSNNQRVAKELTFSIAEAERIYNLYSMYSQPSTQMIQAKTEKEIVNLTNVRRARNYTFEDGDTIYGTIVSYDPTSKSFDVKDSRTGEITNKTGVISHTGKSYVGQAQQALDDIFNSNGNIAQLFTSTRGRIGFVTDKDRSGNDAYRGFKFMALLGSKTAPVPKSYNEDGSVKETYSDVIDILEDLFNFGVSGELPSRKLNYINEQGQQEVVSVQFRVPVPLNARNEAGELEFDYTFSSQNTSRDTAIPNSKFFENNFDNVFPTRIFVDFTQEEQTEVNNLEQQLNNTQPIETISESKQEQEVPPSIPVTQLTPTEISTLSFNEIRQRLSEADKTKLDTYAKNEGFEGIDHFFAEVMSAHPEEQELFRDYIIDCLL